MAARSKAPPPTGKGREIVGICLLGFGVFCALSLISQQASDGTQGSMMGPGGQATAGYLTRTMGITAYLVVAAFLVVAVRVFRGRPLHRSLGEVLGVLGIVASSTVLLYMPSFGLEGLPVGPGGLLGEWLGGLLAGFVGSVGAVLVASTALTVSLMLLTNVSFGEVATVLGWVFSNVAVAAAGGARAVGRLVAQMFPEKSTREDHEGLEDLENPFEDNDLDDEEGLAAEEVPLDPEELDDTLADPADKLPPIRGFDQTIKGMPEPPLRAVDSEAVSVGKARHVRKTLARDDLQLGPADDDPFADDDSVFAEGDESGSVATPPRAIPRTEPRRPMSAVVAEVAAVECAAVAAQPEPDEVSVPPRSVFPPAPPPVITTPGAPGRRAAPAAHVTPPPIIIEAEAPPVTELGAVAPKPRKEDSPGFIRLSEGDFRLPAPDLLQYVPPPAQEIDKQGLYEMAARLEQAMSNYGVKGTVSAINMGPVVTMYEFAPAPGTRTGKIAQLENDLAMALEAQAVRIVAPIPGKAVVGVEVPNKNRQTVYLKEILSDDSFRGSGSKLQIALGKDIKGNPVSVNLSKMPHLLVAGTTGSGKSVTVNGMITSVLYNATPEEARFIMVDPKMLELSIYEGIPHLLLPVVTDPKKANLALRWAVDEMERRYEILAKTGVRDIAGYNAKIELELAKRKAKGESDKRASAAAGKRLKVVLAGPDGEEQEIAADPQESLPGVITEEMREEISDAAAAAQSAQEQAEREEPPRKLPYIVIVIDEFADLMMVAPKDVETSVARLAQKARAAGLHLILATQRPSVDVITGLIKANFPSRVALQVASKIDSRTILDQPGAETLLGNGDMLFSDRGTKLRRLHGAFLSDDEVHRVVDFLKTQAKPVYDMDILKPREDEGADSDGAPAEAFNDPLYDQAVAIVCETRQASVSFIQRRLQIGYNRSARMVEQMERDGIVGPANGIKPREVLAPAGDYLTSAP